MVLTMRVIFFFQISLVLLQLVKPHDFSFPPQFYHFHVKEASYTRLCSTKNILTVNGQFPGPSIYVNKGDTIMVTVYNEGRYNITIHWHGVKQPRNPWSDGPEYITQCPILPGGIFRQKIIFSTEEGTLWWHAHSDWSRATVHGAIIVYPKPGSTYPFPAPYQELPIILGEWWKRDVMQVLESALISGGDFNASDAFTINGQPGDLYACSNQGTLELEVEQGRTYLLRIVNAAMNNILFFAIANHDLITVGVDGGYTKPLKSSYITIAPGQTMDAIFEANQNPSYNYYMAARAYNTGRNPFDNTTTTAIIQYASEDDNYFVTPPALLPQLPNYNDTNSALDYVDSIRSLASDDFPSTVPLSVDERIITTVSINSFPCRDNSCAGPNGTRLATSMNNISFQNPQFIDILEAYYFQINGVYGTDNPNYPPLVFNFTSDDLPLVYETPKRATQVKVVAFNTRMEIVFQSTNLLGGIDHPMHIHGHSFYVVGTGLGNFDPLRDPLNYNLVDPPFLNTVIVPINGWATIRFNAANPGVWFVHCHFERHLTWGMDTVLIVRNGNTLSESLLPRPLNMPPCV